MNKLMVIDCEMGGRDLNLSLLTASFIITDDKFEIIDQLHLYVKPDDGIYILSGQGMRVNKINICSHDVVAIPYKLAKTQLFEFLNKNSIGGKLTPVGHGVKGDIEFVIKYILSRGSWEQFCTYHFIDTSVVLQFLRLCDKMPFDRDGSIQALVDYFGIECDKNQLHAAAYDATLNLQVLKKMIERGKCGITLSDLKEIDS